ncbi:MAG: Hsp20/alpha crystallin family protein [Candidatus Methanolliviera hydrocarbonicum]|uniref:Hsp20/alpha crystallin family protein n=1 Tax=Candidatus Methanolliviera hydrocarbonicum TaxID=2491085 RepID=A0A520KUB7_9EURY|nr:MAG: Hsp20/alpha crystallin family protein [Candidatus Methanolliviera hydrocarbonicum]
MEDNETKKDAGKSEKDYEERMKILEKRIGELETGGKTSAEGDEPGTEPSVVGDVVSRFIPGLGGIIKTLEKASPEFKQRIAETDSEIKHRIEMGWESKPQVEYGISMRPLGAGVGGPGRKRAAAKPRAITVKMPEKAPIKEPIIDVFEEEDHISVIAELPGVNEKDIEVKLVDDALEISAGDQSKTIKLPATPKSIIERTYKHGVLQLKIEKMS